LDHRKRIDDYSLAILKQGDFFEPFINSSTKIHPNNVLDRIVNVDLCSSYYYRFTEVQQLLSHFITVAGFGIYMGYKV